MVFTRFGWTQAFCQRLVISAAQLLQSGTQLSSNLFYALRKHHNYSVCRQVGKEALRKLQYTTAGVWWIQIPFLHSMLMEEMESKLWATVNAT